MALDCLLPISRIVDTGFDAFGRPGT